MWFDRKKNSVWLHLCVLFHTVCLFRQVLCIQDNLKNVYSYLSILETLTTTCIKFSLQKLSEILVLTFSDLQNWFHVKYKWQKILSCWNRNTCAWPVLHKFNYHWGIFAKPWSTIETVKRSLYEINGFSNQPCNPFEITVFGLETIHIVFDIFLMATSKNVPDSCQWQ